MLARLAAAAGMLALAPACTQRSYEPEVSDALRERAAAIHRDGIVIDGHNDLSSMFVVDGFDLAMSGNEEDDRSPWLHWMVPWLPFAPEIDRVRTQTDFARAAAGGLDAQFFSVWASDDYYDPEDPTVSVDRANAILDAFEGQLQRHPDRMELALTADDVRRIVANGKLAALLGIEGGHVVTDDLATLGHFHARGVRYMTLTWSFTHAWADSSGSTATPGEDRRHGGLSSFGEQVVREMNDLGMLVDISHVSDETFWDAIAASRAPIIASHSSARALAPHPRNMTDEMLRAVGENGGVVMVNFIGFVLDPNRGTIGLMLDSWLHGGLPEVSVSHLVDHIEYIAKVAGIEHVGLGSDFDGSLPSSFPVGLRDVSDYPNITLELLRRGYTSEQIYMILGENVLRVLAAAEHASLRAHGEGTAP